ncbi:unnamed protein product [Fraxinus pennsylvanica]|uniref:CASP-like protein n=1 Tax=Fraxinus pennsylvanica TaxID=56036 RepID=A0AAD1YM42_9LAMI|nr:unnamed protein product [Fraxinus pennsylvanica]
MENSDHNKKSLRRSSNNHTSMSDTDSTTSQVEFYSPLRYDSPLRSDDFHVENDKYGNGSNRAIVAVDTHYSPFPLPPGKPNLPASSPAVRGKGWKPWPHSEKPTSENLDFPASQGMLRSENLDFPAKNGRDGARGPPVSGLNRYYVRDEVEEGYGGGGGEDEVGGEWRSRAAGESILERSKAEFKMKKVALFFRVFEVTACLISFSVMAADKTQGWSGDSFDRYKEYRYCLCVNIIGFVYSGFQAVGLAHNLVTENHVFAGYLPYHFDFSMDQSLAYLLISASSSAATRVHDWILNWGQDEFTLLASASVGMSFMAFLAFAISSIISSFKLWDRVST